MLSAKMIPFWLRGQRIISFVQYNSIVIVRNGELWQVIHNQSFTKNKKSGFGLQLVCVCDFVAVALLSP